MKIVRPFLLVTSAVLVLFVLGGGLAVKVGAGENSYHQALLFSEVLSLVLENYVDPVDADNLLGGAYEGMLAGLDANGAYLNPDEVAAWKARPPEGLVDPGVTVLKAGSALQVVAVDPGSRAEEGGVLVGDHIRSVDGKPVRDLSLGQAWRLIRGAPGTTVRLELMHVTDDFRREQVELVRTRRHAKPFELAVERGIAVLKIRDASRVQADELSAELDDVRSRGLSQLLLDLRNVADQEPRQAASIAGLFSGGTLLRLRDRSGRLLEAVDSSGSGSIWPGSIAVLVNGATAGSGEALARLIQSARGGQILGEPTYGLGAEPRLYELGNGSGLLLSSAVWETASGESWNGDGIQPDTVIHGKGEDYRSIAQDQLSRALDHLQREQSNAAAERKAA